MFIVIYSFKVKPGREVDFKAAWRALTQLIYQYEGSLGSRLHKNNSHEYIAYAQWPDRETWKNSGAKMPPEADLARAEMKNACTLIATLYELEMEDDLLAEKPFN